MGVGADDVGLGAYFKPDETFTPSAVKAKWDKVMDFSEGSEYPVGMEGKDPHVSSMIVLWGCVLTLARF